VRVGQFTAHHPWHLAAFPHAPSSPESVPSQVDFFFQAEDGIPARNVTGVQTCALPIYEKDRDLKNIQQQLIVQQRQIDELKSALTGLGLTTGSKQSPASLSSAVLLQNIPNPVSGIT